MLEKAVALLVKVRTLLVMGVLVVALSALNFFMGCDMDKEDPKPLYGVPPDSFQQDTDDPQDVYVDQTVPDQMQTYYGPVPMDIDEPEEMSPDVAEEVLVRPLYGVQVDVVDEVPDIVAEDQMRAFYGPMPIDLTESTDAIGDQVDEDAMSADAMFLYGPVPYYGAQDAPQ